MARGDCGCLAASELENRNGSLHSRARRLVMLAKNNTNSTATIAPARREVIVSGGAYGSPQLLQLSGIGPGALLQEMGIAVVRDAIGVGSNLQDHFNVHYTYRCTKPVTFNDLYNSTARRIAAGVQYALTGSGPLSGNGIFAGAFVRSDPRLEQPDLQINLFGMSIMRRNREGLLPHPRIPTQASR